MRERQGVGISCWLQYQNLAAFAQAILRGKANQAGGYWSSLGVGREGRPSKGALKRGLGPLERCHKLKVSKDLALKYSSQRLPGVLGNVPG